MNIKPQLIDMIRTVPEIAVRLWAGASVKADGDDVLVFFPRRPEEKVLRARIEAMEEAKKVVEGLKIRWMGRVLHSMGDLLELRHAAEDCYLENLFSRSSVPKVLFIPAGQSASGYYRAMIPSEMMLEGNRVISHFTVSVDLSKILRYDILWIQLITSPILIELAKQAQAQGLKVVYDIDDNLKAIPKENQAISVYGEPGKQGEIMEMIKLADLVTVSTAPLAKVVREFGAKDVRVLRNQMTANVAPRRHPPDERFVKILWAGSPTHKRDLAIVAPALNNILKRHAGKVRFVCMGERLPEALADCYEYIDLIEPVDFFMYHDKIASLAADFGIAPLEKNEFNDSKSAIKAIEYASSGYPMLLSPVGEYPVVVADGLPAELVQDENWEEAIERMIAMPRAERDLLGKHCTEWVINNRCVATNKGSQWADTVFYLTNQEKPKAPKEGLKLVT